MAESAYKTWKLTQKSDCFWMFISALTSFIVQRNGVINQWSPQAAPQTGMSWAWEKRLYRMQRPRNFARNLCYNQVRDSHWELRAWTPTIACQAHPILQHVEESGSPEPIWVCKSFTGSSAQTGLRMSISRSPPLLSNDVDIGLFCNES